MKNQKFFYDTSFEDYSNFQQGKRIHGKIVDLIDNSPVPNAKIALNVSKELLGTEYVLTLSDEEGNFECLVPIGNKTYFAHFIAEGMHTKTLKITENRIYYDIKLRDLYYHDRITDKHNMKSVYKFGAYVFGSKKKFNSYLLSSPIALGGVKPIELLSEDLYTALGRIEYGIYC